MALFRLDRLSITPPPADLFEDLLGYEGTHRLVGFYYDASNPYFCDGELSAQGNWHPWRLWHGTLSVEIKMHYCFGYDDREPEHMLILDRKSRALYAGELPAAREVLRQQLPCLPETEPLVLSWGDMEKLKDQLFARFSIPADEYQAKQEKLQVGIERLKGWLNHR